MLSTPFRVARRGSARLAILAGATALATFLGGPASAEPGVDPTSVDKAASPASSFTVDKVIHTPEIPPNPDIVLVVDTTGSMGPAIANVRSNLHQVVTDIRAAQPTMQGAVVSYKDESDGAGLFEVRQPLTDDEAAIQAAIDGYLEIGGFLDAGFATQAGLNLDAFERACGRVLDEEQRGKLQAQQHQALRWTYLGSGMVHPKFKATLAALSPAASDRVAAVASAFA